MRRPLYKRSPAGNETDKLIERAQYYVNRYIRLRDTDENGKGQCITCGNFFPIEELQAGHFIPSGKYPTRFDEGNIHVQCKGCNCGKGGQIEIGEKIEYTVKMIERFGIEAVYKLLWKSKTSKTKDNLDISDIKEKYKEKAKEELKKKNFEFKI